MKVAVLLIERGLAGVDQDVVIAATKRLDALMNPDGLHIRAQGMGPNQLFLAIVT